LPNLAALAEFDPMIPYLVVQEWTQTELKLIKVQRSTFSSRRSRVESPKRV
jgi:hypothetical protein